MSITALRVPLLEDGVRRQDQKKQPQSTQGRVCQEDQLQLHGQWVWMSHLMEYNEESEDYEIQ